MGHSLAGPSKSLSSGSGRDLSLLSLLSLSSPCWLTSPPPVPGGTPVSPEGVEESLPQEESQRIGWPYPQGHCPNREPSSAHFDYEDLQPGASFLGDTAAAPVSSNYTALAPGWAAGMS